MKYPKAIVIENRTHKIYLPVTTSIQAVKKWRSKNYELRCGRIRYTFIYVKHHQYWVIYCKHCTQPIHKEI